MLNGSGEVPIKRERTARGRFELPGGLRLRWFSRPRSCRLTTSPSHDAGRIRTSDGSLRIRSRNGRHPGLAYCAIGSVGRGIRTPVALSRQHGLQPCAFDRTRPSPQKVLPGTCIRPNPTYQVGTALSLHGGQEGATGGNRTHLFRFTRTAHRRWCFGGNVRRRGRESNPREPVLQTGTLPFCHHAASRRWGSNPPSSAYETDIPPSGPLRRTAGKGIEPPRQEILPQV